MDLVGITELSPGTSLRWLCKLERCGLIARAPDASDARIINVKLTRKAVEAICTSIAAAAHYAAGLNGLHDNEQKPKASDDHSTRDFRAVAMD